MIPQPSQSQSPRNSQRISQRISQGWRLDGTTAILESPHLAAVIDLHDPSAGLSQLIYHNTAPGDTAPGDTALAGFVLGISPGASAGISRDDLCDVFLRGSDLVVTYSESARRPFSLQVYWRATVGPQGGLLLDTILSLQTELLESFPSLTVASKLTAATVWQIPDEGERPREIRVPTGQHYQLPTDDSDSVLLRGADGDWSYAEMTHPEDRGGGQVHRLEQGAYLLHRKLGGGFLEKGVIRRLRVRSVFLPRENDLERAALCLASLASEQPPLTV